MSDNTSFSVIVTEGVHDVMAIARILQLKGFREARHIKEIPDFLGNIIPKQYPFEGSELSRRVPYPSFFFREEYWILVSNAGGDSRLISNLKELLNTPHRKDIISRLRGAAVLADADAKTAMERRDELQNQLVEVFRTEDDFEFTTPTQLTLYGKIKSFDMYIFPDNRNQGTLEHILLEGAQAEYPDLLRGANGYVTYAKGLSCGDTLKNFNEEKAVVGAIVSVLKPGKAPQASFHDDNWITANSLLELPLHQSLSDFIETIIEWALDPLTLGS